MNLVNDEHTVAASLWRDAHLLGEVADVVHAIVRGGVQLVDVVGSLLVECLARRALVASLSPRRAMFTVDGLGKDACTGCLAHTTRTAEEVGMRQSATGNRSLQRVG